MSLMSLPTEMHYLIQKFLDHPSLLFLSATSKYFEGLSSKEKVKDSFRTLEQSSLIVPTVLTKNKLLPCYVCLKGLPAGDHFPPLPGDKDDELGNENMGIRACATCMFATKPDCLSTSGVQPNDNWVFTNGQYAGPNCKLYYSRYGTLRRQTHDWLHCPKCNSTKRYKSSPFGRRRKIDEAMLDGGMCPQCYQPVWDRENEKKRLRRNARERQRRREIKVLAEKMKEAERKRQQAKDSGTAASAMTPTTAVAVTPMTTAATPTTSTGMVMKTQMPLSSRVSMPAPLQIPASIYMPPLDIDGTPKTDQQIDSSFMDELEDIVSGSIDDIWTASSAGSAFDLQSIDW